MRNLFRSLLTVACIVMLFNAGFSQDMFGSPVNYNAVNRSESICSADFDGDNDYDLSVSNEYPDYISILINNGDGTYATAVNYDVGIRTLTHCTADFDGDGTYDLAAVNRESDNVSILKNNGDGTFTTAVNYNVGNGPHSAFPADFDGDNDYDLVVANLYSDNVSILLNNGDGTFATAVNYDAGNYTFFVFSADLDGDGDYDLAAVNRDSDNVSILKNNGDGTFAPAINYSVGDIPRSVFSVDLDGDDDFDLAVANANSDNISILMNNGDGTFSPQINYDVGNTPFTIISADFDGDNDYDIATANIDSDNISILKNNGDGSFTSAVNYIVGDGPRSVCSFDLDGDGDNDLAVANAGSDNVSILLNLTGPYWICGDVDGAPGVNILDIVFIINYKYKSGPEPDPMVAADVDGSGAVNILDVVYLINYKYKSGPPPNCGQGAGTVIIDPSPDALNAPWSLDGPNSYFNSGTGGQTINDLVPGEYTLTWGTVSGWTTPSSSPQTLTSEATITFTGTYVEETTETVTDIDGNVYQTVTIGTQVWMAENLKVTKYRNGDPIPNVTDGTAWSGLTTGAYCEYDNDINNVATYGRLYNWYAVDDSRNIAPTGWHVPTDEEWKLLEMFLGMSQSEADLNEYWRGTDEGGKLKETGTTHWESPNTGATNESGFTALPGGWRYNNGSFSGVGTSAHFGLSTEYNTIGAWFRTLWYGYSEIFRTYIYKQDGHSIRCVKD